MQKGENIVLHNDLKIGDKVWLVDTSGKYPEICECVATGMEPDGKLMHCFCEAYNCSFSEYPDLCYGTEEAAIGVAVGLMVDEQHQLCIHIKDLLERLNG